MQRLGSTSSSTSTHPSESWTAAQLTSVTSPGLKWPQWPSDPQAITLLPADSSWPSCLPTTHHCPSSLSHGVQALQRQALDQTPRPSRLQDRNPEACQQTDLHDTARPRRLHLAKMLHQVHTLHQARRGQRHAVRRPAHLRARAQGLLRI